MYQREEDALPRSALYWAVGVVLAGILGIVAASWLTMSMAHAQAVVSPTGLPANAGTTANPLVIAPQGGLLATNGVQGCGTNTTPVATLTSASSVASLTCAGAGSYEVRIIPTSGNSLVGTLTSNDLDNANAPSSRTLYKNGVGALEVASDTLTGGTVALTYRACGGNNLTVGLSSYTSGSAAVYITASYAATLVCLNGSVDTREDRAVRNGKAYSAFAQGTVTAGQYMSLFINNPTPAAGAIGTRIIFSERDIACSNPTGASPPQGWALTGTTANPTSVNTPTTAATVAKRGGNNAGTPTAQAFMTISGANFPDNTTSVPLASRPTFFAPTGGQRGGPENVKKLLDPGQSMVITVLATGTGLANANPTCIVNMIWEEEAVN